MNTKTFLEKIEYLEKILKIYLLFFEKYRKVEVKIKEKSVEITFITKFSKLNFKSQEFDFEALNERIEHYKNALKYAFSVRNKNK